MNEKVQKRTQINRVSDNKKMKEKKGVILETDKRVQHIEKFGRLRDREIEGEIEIGSIPDTVDTNTTSKSPLPSFRPHLTRSNPVRMTDDVSRVNLETPKT